MDEKSEASEATFSLDAGHDVIGQSDALARRAEHEFTRVEDERLRLLDLDELGDVVKRPREVDVRMAARPEHAEETIETDVEARGLHAGRIEWIDPDAPRRDRGADVTIREHHRGEVWRWSGPPA